MAQQALTEAESDRRIADALDDVQRLVVSAYAHLPWCRYLLLQIAEGADASAVRSWLASLAPRLSTASHRDRESAMNVALTAEGLVRLGASPSTMATFSRAFRQGMATEYRSRILGDVGDSAPQRWTWGGGGRSPHVLLAVYALTAEALVAAVAALVQEAEHAGVTVGTTLDTMLLPNGIEHFGFTDGVSQPVLRGTEWAQRATAPLWECCAPGEFLFGHRDESGFVAQGPTAGTLDIGLNGSYLVMRQLQQDVEGFHAYVEEAARQCGIDSDELASKLVGRTRAGRPLAIGSPATDDPTRINQFGYQEDREGLGCPVGAHIRRANPRDSAPRPGSAAAEIARRSTGRHRLLRRGRPYGPTDETRQGDEARGLVFIALNADIERQFELVQQTWLHNPAFGRLHGELDPITADRSATEVAPYRSFTIPGRPVRRRLRSLPSFTTTRGGAYFFLPGVRGLELIATGRM